MGGDGDGILEDGFGVEESSEHAETELRHDGGEIAGPRRSGRALVVRFLACVFVPLKDGGEGVGGR